MSQPWVPERAVQVRIIVRDAFWEVETQTLIGVSFQQPESGQLRARALDPELLHARAESAGIEAEAAGGISLSLDPPAALLENCTDVLSLDLLEVVRHDCLSPRKTALSR